MIDQFIDYIRRVSLPKRVDNLKYWEKRATRFGSRAVFNVLHKDDELDEITLEQKKELFPLFVSYLDGSENLVLDFGCGTGRFTQDLARLINGRALGIDPISRFIEVAPEAEEVQYAVYQNHQIPLDDESVDIVWICLVLGCITDEVVLRTNINEIQRVLKNDGLVFLVTNTADRRDKPFFKYRSALQYVALFDRVDLIHVHDYSDLGERISVLAGRKVEVEQPVMDLLK